MKFSCVKYGIASAFVFYVTAVAADDIDMYADLVKAGKQHIGSTLKDPYSAVYENIFIGKGNNGSPVVCGTVNSKNSYGAYTGRKRFYFVEGSSGGIGRVADDDGVFDVIYESLCGSG